MFLTRLGFGSKIVVTGDVTQIDLPDGRGRSGLLAVRSILEGVDDLEFVDLGSRRRRAPPHRPGHRRRVRRRTTPRSRTDVSDVSIFGSDEQHDVAVDVMRWVGLARLVVDEEKVPGTSELSLLFVDRTTIAELNEKFLGGTGPTDVLAFPMDDDLVLPGRQPDQGGRGPGAPSEGGEPPTSDRRRRGVPGGRAGAGAASTVRRSTTSSRCSSSTACCTCSTTTTPIRGKRRRCSNGSASSWRGSASRSTGLPATPHPGRTSGEPDAVSGSDWAIVVAIVVLFLVSIVLAAAETAFTRMSRIRALSLEEEGRKGAHRLALMLERPERTLNVLLLLILVVPDDERVAARHPARGLVRQRRPGHRPRAADRPVLRDRRGRAEDVRDPAPRPRRAAAHAVPLGASRTSRRCGCCRGLHRPRQRAAPGQGAEGGPVRHRGGPPDDGRRRGRRGGDRARGAPAHPLDLRVRRHRRARGDGAAPRHGRDRGRGQRSRTRSAARSRAATRASPATRTPPTTSSASCT